jgi:hypothetical protein
MESRDTRRLLFVVLPIAVAAAGCGSLQTPLPLVDGPAAVPLSSSAFAGHARAFRFEKGAWVAAPSHDYDFIVLERRFADHRDAVKEIHRRHPSYDGWAGPRDQTLYFSIRQSPSANGGYDLAVTSTLGSGTGHEKPGGAGFLLDLAYAKKGWFVPFDSIRIRQDRSASSGRLRETVELYSKRDGREVPYMKFEEEGLIYRPDGP